MLSIMRPAQHNELTLAAITTTITTTTLHYSELQRTGGKCSQGALN